MTRRHAGPRGLAQRAGTGRAQGRAVLSAIPLFSRVGEEHLRVLAEAGRTVALRARRVVIREGEAGDSLYCVLAGRLRVYKQADDGAEVELRTVGPGESFGELALLDGGARSATVETLTACRLFRLDREAFLSLLPRSPPLLASVLASLTEYVRTTSQRVVRDELEQRAIRAEMELEKYRALAQMVAGVAHEVNTPLGIVNTAASVVKRRVASGALAAVACDPATEAVLADIVQAVELMQGNIQRAHKLIQSFKLLSASQIADSRETLSLPDVVDEVVGLFRINARRAKLDVQIRNALPGRDAGVWVGYRGYLGQVLMNLLTNVERYAYPEGTGGSVEIVIAEAEAGKEACFTITVRDFGHGIPPEARDRVFEPFFTTGRARGATGLGLAIAHNLVTSALKGTVALTSRPGEGTAVTITVPKTIPA